jgi:hypothetical protein
MDAQRPGCGNSRIGHGIELSARTKVGFGKDLQKSVGRLKAALLDTVGPNVTWRSRNKAVALLVP